VFFRLAWLWRICASSLPSFALDRGGRTARGAIVEQLLGGVAGDHAIGDRVGLALVGVTRRPDPAFELNAAALLNHVRRLVGDRVQVGARTEHDVVAGGVGLGTHGARGRGRLVAGVRPNRRDVMTAERTLDRIRER
jgi:hypothetical protein